MKLEKQNPIYEGRYVVYVPGVLGWLQPQIATWTKGAWHYHHSTEKYPDEVKCWAGPLPVVALKNGEAVLSDEMAEPEREEIPQEFDL